MVRMSPKAFSLLTSVGCPGSVLFWVCPPIRKLPTQVSTHSVRVAFLSRFGSCANLTTINTKPPTTEGIFSALRMDQVIHVWSEMSMGTGVRNPFIRCREAPVMHSISVGYGSARIFQLSYPFPIQESFMAFRALPAAASHVHPSSTPGYIWLSWVTATEMWKLTTKVNVNTHTQFAQTGELRPHQP